MSNFKTEILLLEL